MSFSALLLELGLTRLFSVVLFYHFAFLAISIALLGLGAGAVFAYLRREWLERWSVGQLGAWLCAANAVVIVVVLEIVLHTSGGAAPRLVELPSPFGALPGLGGSVFHHRTAVFPGLCAASCTDYPALWSRPAGRIAGLPGAGSAAELYRRAQHHPVCGGGRRVGGRGLGRLRGLAAFPRFSRWPCWC